MVAMASLMALGLVMVASAGVSLDKPVLQTRFWLTPFGRQAIYAVFGFFIALVISRGGHRWLRPGRSAARALGPAVFVLAAVCCAIVLVPQIGTERNGARRWLMVASGGTEIGFQPSELAKFALIVMLAWWFARRGSDAGSWRRGWLPAAGMIAVLCGLVGVEDFGSAALMAATGGLILLVAGVRWRHLLLLIGPAVLAGAVLIISRPYRLARLTAFRNIWDDPSGAGYHPIQSLVTIASGGWTGRGLGGGVQKYGYLPEASSDFIFSVMCEELGAISGIAVICVFVAILWLGGSVAHRAVHPFDRLLAWGITLLIGLQGLINIAVVTVCAPTKGIPLPLISAGGSGLLFLCTAMGLLASIASEANGESELVRDDND